jgi:hypothetical protein
MYVIIGKVKSAGSHGAKSERWFNSKNALLQYPVIGASDLTVSSVLGTEFHKKIVTSTIIPYLESCDAICVLLKDAIHENFDPVE